MILFILVGLAASSFFDNSRGGANFQSPVAKIDLEFYEGGLPWGPKDEKAKFKENFIVLEHNGGDSLPLKSTSIRISGYGNAFTGNISDGSGTRLEGDTLVFYHDLSPEKKNTAYETRNEAVLKDGFWDVGERLVLCGDDSAIGTSDSSVKVSVGGVEDTSDNYGFKAGSEISLKVIDSEGRNVIADRTAVVEAVNN
ncbi:TPA: type IV pilin [Methanosarcinaceae archaeon]|nr:type IV pilin [Methanosarcinaceae archaeon]